jgi:hypothetical protein
MESSLTSFSFRVTITMPTLNTIYCNIKSHLNTMNIINAFIMLVVVVSGAILFMVMVGMISFELEQTKENWFEINAQILCACFTITALLTHPQRFLLLIWTFKWNSKDGSQKREFARMIEESVPGIVLYNREFSESTAFEIPLHGTPEDSRDPSPEPIKVEDGERKLVKQTPAWKWYIILALLHGQCFFQYPITFAHWMWFMRPKERPVYLVAVFLPLSFACGTIGGIWPILMKQKSKLQTQES